MIDAGIKSNYVNFASVACKVEGLESLNGIFRKPGIRVGIKKKKSLYQVQPPTVMGSDSDSDHFSSN